MFVYFTLKINFISSKKILAYCFFFLFQMLKELTLRAASSNSLEDVSETLMADC